MNEESKHKYYRRTHQEHVRAREQKRNQERRKNNTEYQDAERKRDKERRQDEGYRKTRSERQRARATKATDAREIIVWDGEEFLDTGYSLFGDTTGHFLLKPNLSSREMLETILESGRDNPDALHVSFAFSYDANCICKDFPWKNLAGLWYNQGTLWTEYEIYYVPSKWFEVRKGNEKVRIYDVFTFFGSSLMVALNGFNIGTEDERRKVSKGKDERGTFLWDNREHVHEYWDIENRLCARLVEDLRDRFTKAGVHINSWHGPGSLARYALRNHKIKEHMAICPPDVWTAARYAYSGGRFQQFLCGFHDDDVWVWDLTSAYPFAITMLPDLTTGRWEYRQCYRPVTRFEFSLFHIKYVRSSWREKHQSLAPPMPLFRRLKDNRMCWPENVEGWYWGPEAWNVRNDPHAEFLGAWVYVDDGTRPFSWVDEYFQHRRTLKRLGDPAEIAFKLMLNSMYGQLAQRVGWRKKGVAPGYHQLEWAGWTTSVCKSLVHEVAEQAWKQDGLISIDTDAVFSRSHISPEYLPNGIGNNLGEWKETKYSGILAWQSGIYWTRDENGQWPEKSAKSRGMPRGRVHIDLAWKAFKDWEPIRYEQSRFVGMGQVLNTRRWERWRKWVTEPREMQIGGDFDSKTCHGKFPVGAATRMCRRCRHLPKGALKPSPPLAGMHDLFSFEIPTMPGGTPPHSALHFLPWVAEQKKPKYDIEGDEPWEDFTHD